MTKLPRPRDARNWRSGIKNKVGAQIRAISYVDIIELVLQETSPDRDFD